MSNQPETRRVVEKWGAAGHAGFQLVPDLLLKNQAKLGLSPTDLVVLLNITMHWWYAGQRPFPRTSIIAKRMDVQTRTVQRSVERLRQLGLLQKVKETLSDGGEREVCDLTGLVEQLSHLAIDDADYQHRVALHGGQHARAP